MAQVPSTLFLSKQQELSKIWRVENKRARKLTVSDPWKRIICLEILTILSGDFFFFNQKKDTLKKLIFLFWKDSLKSAFEWVLSDYQNKMFWFTWNNSIPFCKIISYDFVVFFFPMNGKSICWQDIQTCHETTLSLFCQANTCILNKDIAVPDIL